MMFPLGRKHFNYGANVLHMEVIGLLMGKSLLKAIPMEEVGEEQHGKVTEAFFVFFKVIVYWLKFGFNYQSKSSI